MEIIIVLKNGVAENDPFVFKSRKKAMDRYEDICRDLLGENFEDIFGYSDLFVKVNDYLAGMSMEIAYYADVEWS
jgi:hypothetical protein